MPRCSRDRVGWTWLLGTVRAWAVGPHASVNFCVHCSLSAGTEVTQAFPRQMAKWVDVTTAVQVFGVAIIADGRQHHDSDHPVFLLTARPKGESRIPAERLEVWGSKVLVSETEAEPFPWLSRYQEPGLLGAWGGGPSTMAGSPASEKLRSPFCAGADPDTGGEKLQGLGCEEMEERRGPVPTPSSPLASVVLCF